MFVLWLPLLGAGAIREPLPYRIDSWHSEDGLPQSSVTCIAQTREGYLWLGTFGGLARFDGVKFKVFDMRNTPRLPSNRVLSVFQERSGALWLGTEEGQVVRCAGTQLQVYTPPVRGTVSKFIKTFVELPEGDLWLLSAEGQLFRLQNGQFSEPSTNSNLQGTVIQTIALDSARQLWIGTDKELAIWKEGKFGTVWDQTCESGFTVEGLASSQAGGMWVAGNGKVRRLGEISSTDSRIQPLNVQRTGRDEAREYSTHRFPSPPASSQGEGEAHGMWKWVANYGAYPWPKGVLSEMHEDRHGQLWLGIYGSGVFRYSTNGAVLEISRNEGLPGNFIRSLIEDREGNIWVGAEGQGLTRIKPAIFRSYAREQGLSSNQVLTICEGQEGELWLGLNGEGIDRLKDGVVQHYGHAQGLSNEWVWSICQDRNQTLWAGTWGGGLFQFEGDRFRALPVEQCGPVVCGLHEDSKGSIWLGQIWDRPEVTFLREGRPTLVKLATRLPGVDARAVVEDRNGNVWLGTMGDGLYRFNRGEQKRFGKENGLSSEFILSLYADSQGALWIGTRRGLNLFQNETFTSFTTDEGLPSDIIVHVAEDDRGNLWCGCGAGVFRVSKAVLNQVACGQSREVTCFSYTRADGLPSLECSSGCQPSGCRTRDGRLWFPTVNGLAVVDPDSIPFNPLAPPILIDHVAIEGETHAAGNVRRVTAGADELAIGETVAPVLTVQPGKQRFEFHYTGLSLTAPEKMCFKYKLEPLETKWVPAGAERIARYSYLRPGDYRFRVLGCNNDGVWNETGASIAVIVLPHFWQTSWFRVLAAGTVLLLFAAAYEVRLAMERRVTRLRLRMARDLHDEVGSNLGAIALLSEVVARQTPGIAEELVEIRRVASHTIDSLRDIVWFLDPAADTMSELVTRMKDTARTMLREAAFEFIATGEEEAPKPSLELRRNVFPMFKEIIHNVARHAQATQVKIRLEFEKRQLVLRVQDNGVGFDERNVRGGNGLKNLRRRAADLGGKVEIQSTAGSGTLVLVTAPIP